jgi:gas vesicle protein
VNRGDEGRILGAFLIGGLLGAGLALLFAPQSGEKTRRDISKFATKVKKDTRELAEESAEAIERLIDKVGERISEVASAGKELSEDTKKRVLKAIENSQKIIEEQKEKLTKLIK